jgi:serine/threonine-protein kinase
MARGGVDVGDLLRGTPYRAVTVLGRGGMGLVVEAERVDLGRRVAVKVLHREIAADRGIVDRLRIEAQTLGRITSPHVVQVLDLGRTEDGRPFLAMERLAGATLRDRIKANGALAPDLALEIADQILRGLGEAHAIGIVHRDVKPENVFLVDERGGGVLAKVLDFGVAKVLRGGGDIAPPVVPTEEGVTVGTPRYLAPEQVLGSGRVDHRADLYAVGLVLWAMLVGKLPFADSSDPVELARRQIQGTGVPPPSSLVPGLPRALDALVARATAKARDDRYPDADAFRRALAVARAALREAQRPPSPARQPFTIAMDTIDPATLVDPTIEAPADPSTADASTRDGPAPEAPTVALPEGATGAAAARGTLLVRPSDGFTNVPRTVRSAEAPHPAPPTLAMVLTPTPPAIAVAATPQDAGRDGGLRTFLVVVAVTVLVLGALATAALLLGGGAAAARQPPLSSVGEGDG